MCFCDLREVFPPLRDYSTDSTDSNYLTYRVHRKPLHLSDVKHPRACHTMANSRKVANNVTRKIALRICNSCFVQNCSSSMLNKITNHPYKAALIGSITLTEGALQQQSFNPVSDESVLIVTVRWLA